MVQGGRWGGVASRRGRHSQPAAARQLDHPQLEAVLHALAHGALDPVLERLDGLAGHARGRAHAQLGAAPLDVGEVLPLEGVGRVWRGGGGVEQVPEELLRERNERAGGGGRVGKRRAGWLG